MAGIKIDFVSDVSKFIGGTKDIEGALDKVADSLDDVAKDADKTGKKIGDDLSDGADKAADSAKDIKDEFSDSLGKVEDDAKDAGRKVGDELEDGSKEAGDAGEKLERKFRDTFDTVKGESKKAGDDVGDNVKRGFKKAEDGMSDFKTESASTSREAAASFTGDFEDVGSAIQETLANSLAGFGPMGAVAGMAAAAGIGILMSVLQSSADKAAEVKEKVIDLAGAIREAGGDIADVDWSSAFEDFADAISDPKSWFEPWQDASKTNAEVIAADAEKLGLSYSDLFQGLAGDSEAAGRALEVINEKIDEQNTEYQRLVADGMEPAAAAVVTYTGFLEAQRTKLEDATKATGDAVTLAELYTAATEGSTTAIEDYNAAQQTKLDLLKEEAEANMSAAEAEAAWAQTVMDSTVALEGITAATDATTTATKDATDAVSDGGTKLDLYTTAGQLASAALLDTADSGWKMIEAAREGGASSETLAAKTQTAREEFIRQATQMGLTEDAARRLADEYGLIPSSVRTTATFDSSAAQAGINRFITTNDGRRIRVYVDTVGGTTVTTGGGGGVRNQIGMSSGGQVPGAASGVYVTGPGSDIDDRVPYRLSPGEFVMDKQAVDQLGLGNLQQANEGMNPGTSRAGKAQPALTAEAIGNAVARALQGMTIRLDGVDYLSQATAARINLALAQGA